MAVTKILPRNGGLEDAETIRIHFRDSDEVLEQEL